MELFVCVFASLYSISPVEKGLMQTASVHAQALKQISLLVRQLHLSVEQFLHVHDIISKQNLCSGSCVVCTGFSICVTVSLYYPAQTGH